MEYGIKYLFKTQNETIDKEILKNYLTHAKTIKFLDNDRVEFIENNETFCYKLKQVPKKENEDGSVISYFVFEILLTTKNASVEIDYLSQFKSEVNRLMYANKDYSLNILMDGISRYYSEQAYGVLNHLENTIRSFLTEVMEFKGKDNWESKETSDKFTNISKRDRKGENILYDTDFKDLEVFLFTLRGGEHLSKTLKKLINDFDKVSPEEYQNLLNESKEELPSTIWEEFIDRYAKDLDIDRDKVKNLLSEVYTLRNKIAHNTTFSKADFEQFNNQAEELMRVMDKLIEVFESQEVELESLNDAIEELGEQENSSYETRETIDTVVVPAQEEGFNDVFLGENQWYDITISKKKINKLRYIAAYEAGSGHQNIRYIAEIDKIVPSDNQQGKKKIIFKGPAEARFDIKLGDKIYLAPQNRRYTTLEKLEKASTLEDLFLN